MRRVHHEAERPRVSAREMRERRPARERACLFDLYGTLVDIHTDENQPSLWRRMAGFTARAGARYEAKELHEAWLRLAAGEEARLAARDRGIPGACPEIDLKRVFAALYAEKGVAADEALLAETAWFFRRASTTHLRLYAGARELLAHPSHPYTLALLSAVPTLSGAMPTPLPGHLCIPLPKKNV